MTGAHILAAPSAAVVMRTSVWLLSEGRGWQCCQYQPDGGQLATETFTLRDQVDLAMQFRELGHGESGRRF